MAPLPLPRDRPPRQRLVEQLRRHGRDGRAALAGQHPQPVVNLVRQVQLAALRLGRDERPRRHMTPEGRPTTRPPLLVPIVGAGTGFASLHPRAPWQDGAPLLCSGVGGSSPGGPSAFADAPLVPPPGRVQSGCHGPGGVAPEASGRTPAERDPRLTRASPGSGRRRFRRAWEREGITMGRCRGAAERRPDGDAWGRPPDWVTCPVCEGSRRQRSPRTGRCPTCAGTGSVSGAAAVALFGLDLRESRAGG